MIPGLMRMQSSRRRLVAKRAIQDRDDFHILLFAAFWLCFNSGAWVAAVGVGPFLLGIGGGALMNRFGGKLDG